MGSSCCIAVGRGGGAVAIASIPAANGTITGCRSKQTGVLRVIDAGAGQRCRAGEAKLTWNQRGPAGQRGPEGEPGPQGPPGSDGGSGYQLVYKDVHYDPVTDPASNPWGYQTPVSEVVDCPGSKKATNGGVVDVIPDPDVPSERPSGGRCRSVGSSGMMTTFRRGRTIRPPCRSILRRLLLISFRRALPRMGQDGSWWGS
jgi:hypothetical protein